jgi:hypothetical protein
MTFAGTLGANRTWTFPWVMTFVIALIACSMGTIHRKMALLIASRAHHVVSRVEVVLILVDGVYELGHLIAQLVILMLTIM